MKYVDKNQLASCLLMPFRQITSLTIEKLDTDIKDVEQFLLLTPSLVYLKLIGDGNFLNGNRWEKFIQKNLFLLNKFEFCFVAKRDYQQNGPDIESIIKSFQTTFWLETKKWFVIYEYIIEWPEEIRLYSIPICISSLFYEFGLTEISPSTFPDLLSNNVSITDNVNTIKINSEKFGSRAHTSEVTTNVICIYSI